MESANELTSREQARLERHLKSAERQRRWPWLVRVTWAVVILVVLFFMIRAAWLAWMAYDTFVQLDAAKDLLSIIAITNDFWGDACKSTVNLLMGLLGILMMPLHVQLLRDHRLIVKLHAQIKQPESGTPVV